MATLRLSAAPFDGVPDRLVILEEASEGISRASVASESCE